MVDACAHDVTTTFLSSFTAEVAVTCRIGGKVPMMKMIDAGGSGVGCPAKVIEFSFKIVQINAPNDFNSASIRCARLNPTLCRKKSYRGFSKSYSGARSNFTFTFVARGCGPLCERP
jgi:hypothetical protein